MGTWLKYYLDLPNPNTRSDIIKLSLNIYVHFH